MLTIPFRVDIHTPMVIRSQDDVDSQLPQPVSKGYKAQQPVCFDAWRHFLSPRNHNFMEPAACQFFPESSHTVEHENRRMEHVALVQSAQQPAGINLDARRHFRRLPAKAAIHQKMNHFAVLLHVLIFF